MKLTIDYLQLSEAHDYLSAMSFSVRQGKDGGNKTMNRNCISQPNQTSKNLTRPRTSHTLRGEERRATIFLQSILKYEGLYLFTAPDCITVYTFRTLSA